MVWKAEAPQGNESGKVRFDVIPYMRGRGVDLGCGPWKIFPHCIGVDQIPGADICSPVTRLDQFADGSMDFVYSSHTLEDIDDTEATLREWWRLLKVGGYLILYLPHKNFYPNIGQPGGNPAHKHDFLPADIVEIMGHVTGDFDLKVLQERDQGNEYSFLMVYQRRQDCAGSIFSHAEARPAKTAAIVRYGAFGDALWASSPIALLKRDGYHVTVYTEAQGHEVLKADPNIDAFIVAEPYFMPASEYLGYWLHESIKYDRWINLVQSVEATLLPQPGDIQFYWSDTLRAKFMDKNYMEQIHDFAEVAHEWGNQKFYPTDDEAAWAQAFRGACPGRMVVINPSGSTMPKFWPHVQGMMDLLDEQGIYSVVLGDLRDAKLTPPKRARIIGKDWPIRTALAVCQRADVVIGTESVMVNAVAHEPLLKVVLLSHSSHENLTKHWANTICTEPTLPCFPCHRIHRNEFFCVWDKKTKAAACQAVVSPQQIWGAIKVYFDHLDEVDRATTASTETTP
jgi:predicted SAM-dependent methyltransferase/ADP-heptose:LPS heptosyltransferase